MTDSHWSVHLALGISNVVLNGILCVQNDISQNIYKCILLNNYQLPAQSLTCDAAVLIMETWNILSSPPSNM